MKRRRLYGWIPDRPDHRDLKLSTPADSPIPPKVDLRSLCPPVQNQGEIGSCVANSSCEAMEYLERKGSGDVPFSRLYVYYWARNLEGTPPTDDSGCQIRSAVKVLADRGVPLESTWPYETANYAEEPPAVADTEAAQHKAFMYYRCPDLFLVKSSIAQGFPVVFGFSVPESFMGAEVASTGIAQYPQMNESFVGGHAVLAIGYDDTFVIAGVQGAMLCQNSWGTNWGQGGLFWLPYRYWDASSGPLADDCWTIRRAAV